MAWSFKPINPVNRILGKKPTKDKYSRNEMSYDDKLKKLQEVSPNGVVGLVEPGRGMLRVNKPSVQYKNQWNKINKPFIADVQEYHPVDQYGQYLENQDKCTRCGQIFYDAESFYRHQLETGHINRER